MNNRIYLDYNATAPVNPKVWGALANINLYANPSSQHYSGKQSLKEINLVEKFLLETFQLSSLNFNCYFHSGATEAFNTFFAPKKNMAFVYFTTDHAAIHAIASHLKNEGVHTECLTVNKQGKLEVSLVKTQLEALSNKFDTVWVNLTLVNNETGVVWKLEELIKLKVAANVKLHIDAVQMLGKAHPEMALSDQVDAYTFSGHKFGALKGVGFSFYKSEIKLDPFVLGGGQQNGLRSGTLNVHGILSLKFALEGRDFLKEFEQVKALKEEIILKLGSFDKLHYIENESANTICLYHDSKRADEMLIHFDMAGLDISTGSACSSGSVEPSHVLMAMGLEDFAKNSIRISLGVENTEDSVTVIEKIESVLSKISS